jgi:squalene-associated FAD-dependent desaturase
MRQPDIAIIGAGYAGMAAAVTLAQHGIPSTVYEASQTLGGRARRVKLKHTPHTLDNGQHLLLGAYHTTLNLINTVNPTPPYLRTPLILYSENGLQLHAPRIPAPWHTLAGLISAHGLTANERFRALTFMLAQQTHGFHLPLDLPLAQLLAEQPRRTIQLLWEPLCLAALNTPIHTASAQTFLNVLRDSLLGDAKNSHLILPTVDLSALFPDAAARYVREQGGEILTGQRVQQLQPEATRYRIGTRTYRAVICAVAPQHLAALTAPHAILSQLTQTVRALRYQSIVTVYVQYAPHVSLPRAMTGLQHTLTQWVFDRGHTHQQHGLFAVVISAPQMQHADLAKAVVAELHQYLKLPQQEMWAHAIVEKRATFSCEAQVHRLAQDTPWSNFYLAGDHIASTYPATLEAATQSGVQCAHKIIHSI